MVKTNLSCFSNYILYIKMDKCDKLVLGNRINSIVSFYHNLYYRICHRLRRRPSSWLTSTSTDWRHWQWRRGWWRMSFDRHIDDVRRLEKLYRETKNKYGVGAYYNSYKGRIVKYCSRKTSVKKFFKRFSNKKVRKSFMNDDRICQKGIYKKTFDYWWNI